MLHSLVYLLFISLFASCLSASSSLNKLLYNTTSGIYEARLIKIDDYSYISTNSSASNSNNNNNTKYLHKLISIPYAEKPARFQQSVLKKYQPGIHPPQDPVACFQSVNLSAYGFFNILQAPKMSEDCLTINLYIPAAATPAEEEELKNMPVVVHIHGGSNMVGGAALFDGSILASHGKLIVAVINYRLSVLGFLSDMSKKYPGNYGLRDQILAIKWIKMNCGVLNCNPNAIALWGHSAGAGDVNWLALSPLSNKLFQRVIIQSGSSFSYWGYDKMPFERYRSMRSYFNCTQLPDKVTEENNAMTRLIDECLINLSLNDLFSFKFALIDAPGPIYDGFLGEDSLIDVHSPREIIERNNSQLNLDILTGINGVEGFAFEGYFSQSVKFWTQKNLANEVILTMERYSLLTREKCQQNSIIGNRIKFENYYEEKIKKLVTNKDNLDKNDVKRLKAIFANSDAIFDSGFIEFLRLILNKKLKEKNYQNNNKIFVYEYQHENTGNQSNINLFKQYLNKNYSFSTHFDGIDFAFGLPIVFTQRLFNKTNNTYDTAFSNFMVDHDFGKEDAKLSMVVMTYFSNFIKNGDPNVGVKVPQEWKPYTEDRAYLKLNMNLAEPSQTKSQVGYGIRDDLYEFWFGEMNELGNCVSYNDKHKYVSRNHTWGKNPALDRCLEKLDESDEYRYLREMFLIEYENCIAHAENDGKSKDIFSTICLDIISIRRLLIEYEQCCDNKNQTEITSTICSMKNFNTKLLYHNLTDLIKFYKTSSASELFDSFLFNMKTPKTIKQIILQCVYVFVLISLNGFYSYYF